MSELKREQKTSLLFREVSSLVQQLSLDEPKIMGIYVTQVKLSKEYKICFVYFSTYTDKAAYDLAFPILKLYKPSMRKALATSISGRYVPDLVFLYDENKEKERHMNEILDKVKQELEVSQEKLETSQEKENLEEKK